jgi:hypothetical protein
MIIKEELKEKLMHLLKKGVVTVKFRKKDESIRKMVCTLSEDYLPEPEEVIEGKEKKIKKENPNTLPVWDLEKLAWRSFRIDSVVEYESNF